MDWAAWSQEAVSLMASRTRDLLSRHGLTTGSRYRWDLAAGEILIDEVKLEIENGRAQALASRPAAAAEAGAI